MNLKKIVLDLRKTRKMKGQYPAVVFIIPNSGGVCTGKKGYYVMTYNKNELWFHALSKFRHIHQPERDFGIEISKFKHFTWESTIRSKKLCLISYKNDYLPIGYFSKMADSKESEVNILYTLQELEKKGITEIDTNEEEMRKSQNNEQK